jgi:hypothetical protein
VTRFWWSARCTRRARAVQVVLAGVLAVIPLGAAAAAKAPAAAAAPCVSMTGGQPPSPGNSANELMGVAVRSPCDAWAVGRSLNYVNRKPTIRTLTAHWDGARWTQKPSQDPGAGDSELAAVAALSASSAWAVGTFIDGDGSNRTLIERWDGTQWVQSGSPSPGSESALTAVAATSATSAWAVGWFIPFGSSVRQTLIERWNGTDWTTRDSPAAGTLNGVLGIGWAVGQQPASLGNPQAIIERWDGRNWFVVPGADLGPGSGSLLTAVSATSPSSIWAVGAFTAGSGGDRQMLIEHYDGTGWTQPARPGPGSLRGLSVTGTSDAWAAGDGPSSPAILHYDGTSWVPVPVAASVFRLDAVSASSPASAWSVGLLAPPATGRAGSAALHLRCC